MNCTSKLCESYGLEKLCGHCDMKCGKTISLGGIICKGVIIIFEKEKKWKKGEIVLEKIGVVKVHILGYILCKDKL